MPIADSADVDPARKTVQSLGVNAPQGRTSDWSLLLMRGNALHITGRGLGASRLRRSADPLSPTQKSAGDPSRAKLRNRASEIVRTTIPFHSETYALA